MGDPTTIAEALNQMWVKFLPDIEQRVAVLEFAAAAISEGALTAELREEAAAAAHKLAGSLGTFGLDEGTALARDAESLYSRDNLSGPRLDERATALAVQLRAVLARRTQ
jgi:HPt (histidine-containing phosphotransfer) domain-containing protein